MLIYANTFYVSAQTMSHYGEVCLITGRALPLHTHTSTDAFLSLFVSACPLSFLLSVLGSAWCHLSCFPVEPYTSSNLTGLSRVSCCLSDCWNEPRVGWPERAERDDSHSKGFKLCLQLCHSTKSNTMLLQQHLPLLNERQMLKFMGSHKFTNVIL